MAQITATASEGAIKAAYLLNFTRYVEWPAQAFSQPDSPITICVVGADPFGPVLDNLVRDRRVEQRAIRVARLARPDPSRECHVAFLAQGSSALAQARAAWRDRPILLVGNGPEFAADGGSIGFVNVDETIRFEINAGAAQARGLQISSRVLSLATRVYGTTEGP